METDVILASRSKLSLIAAVTHKCAYAVLPEYSSSLERHISQQDGIPRTKGNGPFRQSDDRGARTES